MQPTAGWSSEAGKIEPIRFDGMTLDITGHSVIDAKGREVTLTRGERAILMALARRPGCVLTRDQLLDAVSGRNADAFDRSIDNLIVRLRRKIERDPKKPRLILTVKGAGYKFAPFHSDPPPLRVAPHRSTILVLPFANGEGDAELSNFAAAISTHLLAELGHVVGARVLYHASSGACALETGRQYDARYTVTGSVRRRGSAIRVNAQMTDVQTGIPVWADRIDGRLAELFAFETETSARIARAVDLEFIDIESRRDADGAAATVDDLAIRGCAALCRPRSAENLATARRCFDRALRIDDRHAEALAGLAQAHISETLCRWSNDPEAQVQLAEAAAARAIELNPRLASAHHARGLVLKVRHLYEQAAAAFDMAVQLSPSLAPAHAELGFAKHLLGEDEDFVLALEGLARARRLSPRDPVLANWLYGTGIGFLKVGEIPTAIRWLNESIGVNPLPPALAYLAAAHALNGDDAHARSALGEFQRMRPRETLRTFGQRIFADHQILPGSRVFEGLRKAGLRAQ